MGNMWYHHYSALITQAHGCKIGERDFSDGHRAQRKENVKQVLKVLIFDHNMIEN